MEVPIKTIVGLAATILYEGEPVWSGPMSGEDWTVVAWDVVVYSGAAASSKGLAIAAVIFDGYAPTNIYSSFNSVVVGSGDASLGSSGGTSVWYPAGIEFDS